MGDLNKKSKWIIRNTTEKNRKINQKINVQMLYTYGKNVV